MYPSIPRKSARMSRMNFSSSTTSTRARSSGPGIDIGEKTSARLAEGRRRLRCTRTRVSLGTMAAARDEHALGAQAGRFDIHRQGRRSFESGRPALRILAWYGVAAVLAAIFSIALRYSPLSFKRWLGARGAAPGLLCPRIRVPLGAATLAPTRVLVRTAGWAH